MRPTLLLRAPLVLLLGLAFAACDNDGNGGDDNNPTRVTIHQVTIETAPPTNPGGDDWDDDPTGVTSDPDLYFELFDSNGQLILSTSNDDRPNIGPGEFPVSWSFSPGAQFNQFNRTLHFEVYDNDPNGRELMGTTEAFTLQTLADQGFRTFVSLESPNGDLVVSARLRWEE
ncbi:MAG TPA: hypothetical protein VD962_12860 [Rubricoccaceae bacterium]|nr:hypothetical protein [Rubricoccaceae bacterium]